MIDFFQIEGFIGLNTTLEEIRELDMEGLNVKDEPLSEEDIKAFQKDRQKKDNHNMSKKPIANTISG